MIVYVCLLMVFPFPLLFITLVDGTSLPKFGGVGDLPFHLSLFISHCTRVTVLLPFLIPCCTRCYCALGQALNFETFCLCMGVSRCWLLPRGDLPQVCCVPPSLSSPSTAWSSIINRWIAKSDQVSVAQRRILNMFMFSLHKL